MFVNKGIVMVEENLSFYAELLRDIVTFEGDIGSSLKD